MVEAHSSNYLVMSVADIVTGRADPSVRPGWAMGSFYAPADLRFSTAFEIKNWDAPGVQAEWRNHLDSGSEYIYVVRGTLAVILGRVADGTDAVVEIERVLVTAGQVIVLRAGQWRRFEPTDDVLGVTVRAANKPH